VASFNIGKQSVVPRKVTAAFVGANVLFHVVTIALLAAYVHPSLQTTTLQGDADTQKMNVILFLAVFVPEMILSLFGTSFVRYVSLRLKKNLTSEEQRSMMGVILKAETKIGWFTVAVVFSFLLRNVLDFVLIYYPVSDNTLQATLIFAWNSIPEIILCCVVIWLTWINKSSLSHDELEQTLLANLVAPETYHLDEVDKRLHHRSHPAKETDVTEAF